jgi:hypothetical protein
VWFFCREHKMMWCAGYDLALKPPLDEASLREECKRRFDELGLGEFKYLGPDAEGYEQRKRDLDDEGAAR